MNRCRMFLRVAAILCLSFLSLRADDLGVRFPLETRGGKWAGYEPVDENLNSNLQSILKHGDVIRVGRTQWLALNRKTGVSDLASRPAFPQAQESIACDADSGVFWTRPSGTPTTGPYFVRDWTSGEKLGELTLPTNVYPGYFDAHGMASINGQILYVTDSMGPNPRQATLASLGVSAGEIDVTGCENWLAISYRAPSNYRVVILNRATLQVMGNYVRGGTAVAMRGNLLAWKSGLVVSLFRLPDLTPISGVPVLSPTQYGAVDFRLVENGLWVHQELQTQEGSVFLHYDLSNLPAVRLRERVTPPGVMLPYWTKSVRWVAAEDYLGMIDDAETLWVWNRNVANTSYQPLLDLEASQEGHEGGSAQARLTISDPVSWPVQVTLKARSGSAMEGSDFAPWMQTVTIPAGETSALVDVPVLADTVLEPNEFFEVSIQQVSGALAQNDSAPLVIAGNGYNLEANPQKIAGGKAKWTGVLGSNGRVLVGMIQPEPLTTGVSPGMAIVDMETGNIIANPSGSSWPPNFYKIAFRENLVVVVADSGLVAYRTDTGASVGSWYLSSNSFIGMVDTTKVLVRASFSNGIELRRISDGALLASASLPSDATVAVSQDARDGSPSSIHAYAYGGGILERVKYNRIIEFDRNTLAATERAVWRSSDQDGGDYAKILNVWEDKVFLSVPHGLSVVNRTTGKPVWSRYTATSGLDDFGCVISGNAVALTNLFTGTVESSQTTYFVDLETGCDIERFGPLDLSPEGQWIGANALAYDGGWVLVSRNRSFRVVKTPDRPNVKIVAPAIADNEVTTLRVVPREGFAGTYPVRISEYAEITEDRPVKDRLLGLVPVDLNVDADGVDFTVAATRSAKGSETTFLRAAAPGRETLFSGARGVVVNSHVITIPSSAFTTGGPLRITRARAVAAGEGLLAVGYPLELMPDGIRAGLVDIYDREGGTFLRTIGAPAGAEGKRFGHALGVSGNKVIVGAPSEKGVGRTFAYDGTTGTLISELILRGKAAEFGGEIKANDKWIAVTASGSFAGSSQKSTGIVMVFDAVSLKPVFTKSTKGEGFGYAIGLSHDRLFVSAPGAKYQKMYSVGLIRAYSLPKGKQLGTIMARQPKALESFGAYLDASDSVLVIGGVHDPVSLSAALQVHSSASLGFLGYYSMPGDPFAYSIVKAHGDWIIGSEQAMRFFLADNPRPIASRGIVDPGGLTLPFPYFSRSNLAAYGDALYWADYAPKMLEMPEKPAAPSVAAAGRAPAVTEPVSPDANGDGVVNEIDMLIFHRGDTSLPARATLEQRGASGPVFRIVADDKIPANLDLWFEVSTDLSRWEPVLEWRHDDRGWRDAAGEKLTAGPDSLTESEIRATSGKVFFRTRATSR
ncbi:Calx-beta domain-containing protein [Luteolibacter soli]|uniref:Calx-beta domain-containing protein n=1 Tax=Luteolibacter soli TaxID=3135280 RepID=A0ABU9AYW9_9BACT